jgi:hypothetical protein
MIEDVGAEVADTIRNMERLDLSKREPKEQMEEKEGKLVPKTLTRFEEMKLANDSIRYSWS